MQNEETLYSFRMQYATTDCLQKRSNFSGSTFGHFMHFSFKIIDYCCINKCVSHYLCSWQVNDSDLYNTESKPQAWQLKMLLVFQCLNVHLSFRCCKDTYILTPLSYNLVLHCVLENQRIMCSRTLGEYPTYHFLTEKHFALISPPDLPSMLWASVKHFSFTFSHLTS